MYKFPWQLAQEAQCLAGLLHEVDTIQHILPEVGPCPVPGLRMYVPLSEPGTELRFVRRAALPVTTGPGPVLAGDSILGARWLCRLCSAYEGLVLERREHEFEFYR